MTGGSMIRLIREFGKEPAGFRRYGGTCFGFFRGGIFRASSEYGSHRTMSQRIWSVLFYTFTRFFSEPLRKLISRVVSTARCIARVIPRRKASGSSEPQPDAHELSSKNISAHIWHPANRTGALVCVGVTPRLFIN